MLHPPGRPPAGRTVKLFPNRRSAGRSPIEFLGKLKFSGATKGWRNSGAMTTSSRTQREPGLFCRAPGRCEGRELIGGALGDVLAGALQQPSVTSERPSGFRTAQSRQHFFSKSQAPWLQQVHPLRFVGSTLGSIPHEHRRNGLCACRNRKEGGIAHPVSPNGRPWNHGRRENRDGAWGPAKSQVGFRPLLMRTAPPYIPKVLGVSQRPVTSELSQPASPTA